MNNLNRIFQLWPEYNKNVLAASYENGVFEFELRDAKFIHKLAKIIQGVMDIDSVIIHNFSNKYRIILI